MAREEFLSEKFQAIGTQCEVIVFRSSYPKAALRLAHDEIAALDQLASFFRSDSELTRLNVSDTETIVVSEYLFELLEVYAWAFSASRGLCDASVGRIFAELVADTNPRLGEFLENHRAGTANFAEVRLDRSKLTVHRPVGTILDLGGLAKSWLADRIALRIVEETQGGALVNLGGDIALAGMVPDGGWRVKVTHDVSLSAGSPGQLVAISSGGIATSSRLTRRWVDGSGTPREHLELADGSSIVESPFVSATAAGRSALMANFYALTSLLSGRRAISTMAGFATPALIRCSDGTRVSIGGWPSDGASSKYTQRLVAAQ